MRPSRLRISLHRLQMLQKRMGKRLGLSPICFPYLFYVGIIIIARLRGMRRLLVEAGVVNRFGTMKIGTDEITVPNREQTANKT